MYKPSATISGPLNRTPRKNNIISTSARSIFFISRSMQQLRPFGLARRNFQHLRGYMWGEDWPTSLFGSTLTRLTHF